MPTIWDDSYVDRLTTLSRYGNREKATEDIREAIRQLILPDAAKILVAIAADVVTAIQSRNNRADVNGACAMVVAALAQLEKIDPRLDG